jgi:DNA polymerase-1
MYRLTETAILDIETNRAWDTIWMAAVYLPSSGKSIVCHDGPSLTNALAGIRMVVGHNLIGFDLPLLRKLWGWEWGGYVIDTLVMGRLLNPSIEGGHSLRAWAERAGGNLKDTFDDFDSGLSQEMIDYCVQDCVTNFDVLQYMRKLMVDQSFSDDSLFLEIEVAKATKEQELNGFYFDFDLACSIHQRHQQRMDEISDQLQSEFPPIVTERWSEKTGKRLKDSVEVFNVGSRQQVAKRLEERGAVWKRTTPTGKPMVDEKALEENDHLPEAAMVLEYMTLQKRLGMLQSWIDNYEEDGRIHGRVNTCGAVTGRMTHSSPNLAQVPSGREYRQCFTVPEGHSLVGVDASGLELRMLAHYMGDQEYTDLILNGDIHTHNQKAFGCDTRDQAKTLIYATLYGAGDAKLGAIVGGKETRGRQIRSNFEKAVPAYARLVRKVKRIAGEGSVPGLDGRRVWVRSEHAALNTLLQSAGAIVMKKALVIAVAKLRDYNYPYKLVAQVHDELQLEVPTEYATRVGVVVRNSIKQAGVEYNLRCPLDGEFRTGLNWADTH